MKIEENTNPVDIQSIVKDIISNDLTNNELKQIAILLTSYTMDEEGVSDITYYMHNNKFGDYAGLTTNKNKWEG